MSESSNPPAGEPNTVRGARLPFGTLSACAAVAAAVVSAAVFAAPNDFRVAVAVGGSIAALLLCAAVTAAAYFRLQAKLARDAEARIVAEAQSRMATCVAEASARINEAHSRTQALEESGATQQREVKDSENRRAAAMAAFAGAAGRMQAMSTSMLAELREMEHRHADAKVLADLLELDHRTAQAGRLADSIAVLSGARSGRRWAKPIAMESILRGAMGRVAGYQRVRLRAVAEIAIAGHAAEGVMHALAELLDNACNFSPPTTEVHVYAAEVPAGVVITVEDSGLVMSESALRRAELTVSGKGDSPRGGNSAQRGGNSDLSSLSGTRLGLAVVGHLARKHDLTVSYRPSAIGGTAVVVVVPRELTTRLDRTQGSLAAIPLPTSLSTRTPANGLPVVPKPALTSNAAAALPSAAGAPADFAASGSTTATPALPSAASADFAASRSAAGTLGTAPALPAAAAAPVDIATSGNVAAGSVNTAAAGSASSTDRSPDFFDSASELSGSAPELFGPLATPPGSTPATEGAGQPAAHAPATGFSGTGSVLADRTIAGSEFTTGTFSSTGSGLPRRQRGSTLAAVHPQGLSAPTPPAAVLPSRPPSPAALGAFQRAVNGRENAGAETPSPSLETDR